jgi:hypothetical protein
MRGSARGVSARILSSMRPKGAKRTFPLDDDYLGRSARHRAEFHTISHH